MRSRRSEASTVKERASVADRVSPRGLNSDGIVMKDLSLPRIWKNVREKSYTRKRTVYI